jgi:hypothetical protein
VHLLETGEGRFALHGAQRMLLSGLFLFGIVLNVLPFFCSGPAADGGPVRP